MLRAERHAYILQLLGDKSFIKTEDLAEELKVSHVTIRRDLISLSEQNLIRLEHGGAASIDYLQTEAEPFYDTKLYVQSEAKNTIAEAAVRTVEEGDILILDSGTTCFRFAQKLSKTKLKSLTVITGDIMAAKELSPNTAITVIVLGGILRNSYYNVYGPFTDMILSNLKAGKFYMAFDGTAVGRGFSSNMLEEVPVKQKMMEICDETIALGDSSKFGMNAPYHICSWNKITRVITDSSISEEYREFFREESINLHHC